MYYLKIQRIKIWQTKIKSDRCLIYSNTTKKYEKNTQYRLYNYRNVNS